jgi:hypothetical protein
MLTSWLFMLASSACVMPLALHLPVAQNTAMPGCNDAAHHAEHLQRLAQQKADCLLKPCPDAQQNLALTSKVTKQDIPLFILCLIGLSIYFYTLGYFRAIPRRLDDIVADSVPIRYRFCVLLN